MCPSVSHWLTCELLKAQSPLRPAKGDGTGTGTGDQAGAVTPEARGSL